MVDPALLKSWKVTETLLESARRALPAPPEQQKSQFAALLAEYREFLDRNEFELALDKLEALGHLVPCRGGFWRDLARAAENMGLTERLPALAKSFAAARA